VRPTARSARGRVRLVHWNEREGAVCAERLSRLGYEVAVGPVDGVAGLRALREHPPEAVVIDLSRLPSAGRDVGLALRTSPATRRVPLLFVGGEAAKVEGVRKHLPDAAYTAWDAIGHDLESAIARPPANPVVPDSALAGYSGRPLAHKLGIAPGARVALLGAPGGFADTLGELPAGARLTRSARGPFDLAIWFCRDLAALAAGIAGRAAALGERPIWIAWPKKTSPLASDVSEREVRAAGLAAGLVDYKVCAIDAVWSGLLFRRRRAKPR